MRRKIREKNKKAINKNIKNSPPLKTPKFSGNKRLNIIFSFTVVSGPKESEKPYRKREEDADKP